MSVHELLKELDNRNVRLGVDGNHLDITAPSGAITPELRELLRKYKNQIIAILNDTGKEQIQLKKIKRDGPMPLSYAQQRLWFINKFEEGHDIQYNIPWSFRLKGKLNIEALQKTFHTIIQRHESLRTTFHEIDDKPVQVIADEMQLDIPVIDAKETEIQNYADEHARQPFDLSNGPLIRVNLLRLSSEDHVLLINMHHIVSDGWSMGVLSRELITLYGAYIKGEDSPLPPLPIQYADFAYWQRLWLQGEVLEKQVNYWKKILKDTPPLLELPTDRPRPAKQRFQGATERFVIKRDMTRQLNALGHRENSTLFMVLLAAFQVLLYRYSGQTDICIGTPVANRQRKEIEGLIGFFINMLVIRNQLNGKMRFTDLLKQVNKMAFSAYDHQDVPFEHLVDALKPDRSLSYAPIFQTVFVLQNANEINLELPNLTILSIESSTHTSRFDLTMDLAESNEGIMGKIEYNTGLFDKTTIESLINSYDSLLKNIISKPKQELHEIPILTKEEEDLILLEWNDTNASYPQDRCIHQLFEQQAIKTPDATAIVYEDKALTYKELNERSNQLAHYLIKYGSRPEINVGLFLERSLELVIGILGILKSGSAYVPIDPDYPEQRIEYILSDSDVSLLVTQKTLIDKVLNKKNFTSLCLDRDWPLISRGCTVNTGTSTTPQQLAYVIYTSGSTGKPKGTLIPHENVGRLFSACYENYLFSQQDIWTLFHSCAFDFSVWELWGALIYGGKLIVIPYWTSRTPEQFHQLVYDQRVTVLNQTPSAFNQFINIDNTSDSSYQTPGIRYVIFGGEALDMKPLQPWFDRHGDQTPQLVNMYGITETTVHVTYQRIKQDNILASYSIIGLPLADLQAYVLDKSKQLAPIGAPGELYIGGAGQARGYLHRQDLTAERFIPNQFSSNPGERLYKTGDLVRYRLGLGIDYVGRIDHQVKIRGFRIELGEIESFLVNNPGVQDAVVLALAHEQETQNKYLVAYIVLNKGTNINEDNLRHELKSALPNYMVPAFFIFIEKLPLTSNGKLDRQALPQPNPAPFQTKEYIAPVSKIEQLLTSLWAEVLKVNTQHISINANFFELGGDSILSLQVITRAKSKGYHFTPKQLFEHSTVAELAKVVKKTGGIKVEQGQVTGFAPLLPIQHWFFDKIRTDINHYNQAFLLNISNKLNKKLLSSAIQALLIHHDTLRIRCKKSNSGWSQLLTDSNFEIPISEINLSSLPADEQLSALEKEASMIQKRMDIEHGPLLQTALFCMGNQKPDRLLISVHHIAVDSVSWRILLEDLATAYHQLQAGKSIKLSDKTTSYKDWSEYLQTYAQSDALKTELQYWENVGSEGPAQLPRDRDYETRDNTVGSADICSINLSIETTLALLQEAPAAYNTQVNDILLTALLMAFRRWAGINTLLIDLEGHGREDLFKDVDLSRTVGWFTTIYPICLKLQSISDFGTSLKLIKEQLRQIPNRGIGYGLLRYCCSDINVVQKVRALPEPQISFNYLGQFNQIIDNEGLFKMTKEAVGQIHSPDQIRPHIIAVVGLTMNDSLQLNIEYSRKIHDKDTIEILASHYLSALYDLIKHCTQEGSQGYTPSDFPNAGLDSEELDELINDLELSK